jgi:hypothetical protein
VESFVELPIDLLLALLHAVTFAATVVLQIIWHWSLVVLMKR